MDYTIIERAEFNRFLRNVVRRLGEHVFPYVLDRIIIDGCLEVYTHVQKVDNGFELRLLAGQICRNGFLFHKDCLIQTDYEFYFKNFLANIDDGEMDYIGGFNAIMAFYKNKVPHMKLRGDKLLTAEEYVLAVENENYDQNRAKICTSCFVPCKDYHLSGLDIEGRSLIAAFCPKCYLELGDTFDTDKTRRGYYLDKDKYEFDQRGKGRVVCEILGVALSLVCGCADDSN